MRITKSVGERRQEIIDTARELFLTNGFEKTQVSDISKKMNVAQGLVYHYFKSKTEMLYAVVDELAGEKLKEIEATLYKSENTAIQKLETLLKLKLSSNNFIKQIPNITNDVAIIQYCSNKMSETAMPILLSLIEQGNADGSWDCKYPDETSTFFLKGINGFLDNSQDKEDIILGIILNILCGKEQ